MIDLNKHIFICGETGSGKTTIAEWLYKNCEGIAIFFNTQLEYRIEQDSDALVSSMSGFRDAWNAEEKSGFLDPPTHKRKYHKICFNPDDDIDVARQQLDDLVDTLFSIGLKINKDAKKPQIWVRLFIDEIHEYSEKGKEDKTVDRLWRRGRRYGIVAIGISQRPADVSHGILSQCPTHIIFKVNRYESPYFQRYKIPVFFDDENNETNRWLHKKYHFAVFTGDNLEKYPPVDM